jgi:hypothetical protein
MVVVADSESWQRIFQLMMENSRWDLTDAEVGRYLERSFDYIVDFLRRIERSEPYRLDPSGDQPLRLAKRVRRAVLRREGDVELREEAERHFGMPESNLHFSEQLELPLYTPSR